MIPIHVVAKLKRPLTAEDLLEIQKKAEAGFEISTKNGDGWKKDAAWISNFLRRNGFSKAADDFVDKQQRMAEHRLKPRQCSFLGASKEPTHLELRISDGMSIGRMLFRVGSTVANAWSESFNDDVFVVETILEVLCGDLADGRKTMVEDSKEYCEWMESFIVGQGTEANQ